MTEAIRIWFLAVFGLGLAATLAGYVRFRTYRAVVETNVGPLPTPAPLVVAYAVVMLPLAVWALGRFGVPGIAVLSDHGLVTTGPFQLVRHPGYSAVLALWLGAAIGTLNWLLLALWSVLLGVMFLVTREEEVLLRQKFGRSHDAYAAQTGRFIPKIRTMR